MFPEVAEEAGEEVRVFPFLTERLFNNVNRFSGLFVVHCDTVSYAIPFSQHFRHLSVRKQRPMLWEVLLDVGKQYSLNIIQKSLFKYVRY